MTPSEALAAAADLIEKPGAWTQWTLAKRADGSHCAPRNRNAVCWCAAGAISCVATGILGRDAWLILGIIPFT